MRAATGGLGADHVFIAAGGASNEPVHIAARIARDRARVVDIGKTRLDLPWNEYYEKELDVRFSRSYGPGRYDERYELEGIDYPAGYVRWTERRNLACFIELVERGALSIDLLVSGTFPVEDATDVYGGSPTTRSTASASCSSIRPRTATDGARSPNSRTDQSRLDRTAHVRADQRGALRVGFIGAGNYATSMLLPHLRGDERVELPRSPPPGRCRR